MRTARGKSMTLRFDNRFALVWLILAVALQPLGAQNSAATTKTPYVPFHYRQSDEISIAGTVFSVQAKFVKGTANGSHLALATSQGTIDVSLGPWAMLGPNHLSVDVGDEVSVTGVFTTVDQKQILFARSIYVDGRTYPIRNEQGVALSPQARLRGNALSQDGGPR